MRFTPPIITVAAFLVLAVACAESPIPPEPPVLGRIDIQVYKHGRDIGSTITPVHIGVGQREIVGRDTIRHIARDTVITQHFVGVAMFRDLSVTETHDIFMFRRTGDGETRWLKEALDLEFFPDTDPYLFYTMFVP